MIIKYLGFILGLIWSYSFIKTQSIFSKDTAHFAFQNFKTFSALNSTFSAPYNKNQDKQIKDLKMFVNQWNSNKKNLVLITHYRIITAVTDAVPSSGEIVVTDKNFRVIGTIRTD